MSILHADLFVGKEIGNNAATLRGTYAHNIFAVGPSITSKNSPEKIVSSASSINNKARNDKGGPGIAGTIQPMIPAIDKRAPSMNNNMSSTIEL